MDLSIGAQWLQRGKNTRAVVDALVPVLWAQRDQQMIALTPQTSDAANMAPKLKTLLLSLAASAIDATHVGALNEAWVKQFPADAMVNLRPGMLADIADTDPTVRTCIIVTTADVETHEVSSHLAVLQIDDWGTEFWADEAGEDPHGLITDMVRAVTKNHLLGGDDLALALYSTAENLAWNCMVWSEA